MHRPEVGELVRVTEFYDTPHANENFPAYGVVIEHDTIEMPEDWYVQVLHGGRWDGSRGHMRWWARAEAIHPISDSDVLPDAFWQAYGEYMLTCDRL